MTTTLDLARSQLAEYGYSLAEDGRIMTPSGNPTGAFVSIARDRFRVTSDLASIGKVYTGLDLGAFLARFWYAKRLA